MPPGVDLLVLDHAPLELAGRVAARGRLLFDDDPVSRVRWEATTRKIYFDELPRITRAPGVRGPPADNGDAVRLLGGHGVLTTELAISIRKAVGFRNVLVP